MHPLLRFCTVVAVGLIGYCAIYDYRRRRSPTYKRQVYEHRLTQILRKLQDPALKRSVTNECSFYWNFMQAQKYLDAGNEEKAVTHFVTAGSFCSHLRTFLEGLRITLPQHTFHLVFQRCMQKQLSAAARQGEREAMPRL